MFDFSGFKGRNAWMGAAAIIALAAAPAVQAQTQTIHFQIPAQPLAQALAEFSRQTGAPVMTASKLVEGKTSADVDGDYTPIEALSLIIKDTDLSISQMPTGGFVLSSAMEVVVTGSHIRGGNPTSPIHVVTRRDIDQSGYSQVGDLIRSLPENFSGGQNPGVIIGGSNTGNQNTSNSSTANLRGLGTDATLVLVNGHRMSADAFFQGSDISGIPLTAVSRVEVVADGASSVYGSDAVAGVVNFVLRKDYNGGQASARIGGTTEGGGEEQTYTILQGVSKPDWNLLVNVEYSKQEAVTAGQREFTSTAVPITTLLRPQERRSIFVNFGWNISDNLNFNIDTLVSDRRSQSIVRYTPIGTLYTSDVYTPSYLLAPTIEYKLSDTWTLKFSGTISGSRNSRFGQNFASYGNSTSHAYYRNYVNSGELGADGILFRLPSGDVKAAIGAGYREVGFQSGYSGSSSEISKDENVKYVYGELIAPLVSMSDTRTGLHQLEISLSGRSEDYSTFGSTTTPKVGFRYQPLNSLTLRGTWGKSFKAPSFLQRYQPYYVSIYVAQAYGFSGVGSALTTSGGNSNLKPEKSKFWTFGADYSPSWTDGLKLSATYFDIDYTDRVVNPITNVATAFTDPTYDPFIEYNPSLERQSDLIDGAGEVDNYNATPYDPSSIVAIINNNYQNATAQTVKGFDFSARKTFSLNSGNLSAFANATQLSLVQTTVPTAPEVKLSGTIYNVPKFKARAGANWQRGPLSLTGIVNYVSSEWDTGITPYAKIASWTTADANLSYVFGSPAGFWKGVKFDLSASNLLDRQPPYARSPAATIPGIAFDSTNYSVLGRQISVTLSKAW